MNSKTDIERDIKLSKKLTYILRHGALREKIRINADGFVRVDELLKKILYGHSASEVRRIATDDVKQRFALRENNNILEIRANQGHSIREISQLTLRLVENPDYDIIHGTYSENWPKIESQGLSRMKRNHIHFAKGLNFLCGLKASSDVYIYADFARAERANLKFFESANGVILCGGDERGILETRYFLKVVKRDGEILLSESRDKLE